MGAYRTKKKRAVQKYTSLFLAATVTTMQVTGTWKVYDADTSAVELEVEEVYA